MTGNRGFTVPPQADMAILSRFANCQTANISDNLERLPGSRGLLPFHKAKRLVGTAFTIRTRAGDNKIVHEALDYVRPGDVMVIDGEGDTGRALVGEIIVAIAKSRGVAGLVIDGAIRDAAAIGRDDYPVFARSAVHRGPYKTGPGEINVPVTIGGMVVCPGYIVVGDADGVVALPQEGAEKLLAAIEAQAEREAEILRMIADGSYKGAYDLPFGRQ